LSKSDHSSQRTDEDQSDPSIRTPAPGERIGRYFVLDELGEGAMGVVLRAFDPDLERSVAIKLVAPQLARSARSETSRARLLVEARAQARISHPNVVAVYEVGEHRGLVYVAMELVEGVDLQRWLKSAPRSWREICGAFVAAGRGLHQVHVAGLVHRDVKAANILVGNDGRVRVGDFGIARATYEVASPVIEGIELDDGFDLETTALTAEGRVVGTLAYMAPEQHTGSDVGPAADQYAFCVALYEALWGRRPYTADLRRLYAAKLAGPDEPPRGRGRDVPRWLYPVTARGLQADPQRRYADMAELCDALGRDPRAQRRKIAGIAAATIAVTGAIAFASSRADVCDDATDPLQGVWDPQTRDAVEKAFAASERPWAAPAWAHAGPTLDAYANEWAAMRHDACLATHVRGEQSSELLDRRTACLETRRRALAATTAVLAEGADQAIDHAFDLVGALRPLAPCADSVALLAAVAPPDDAKVRDAVDQIRTELAGARAAVGAGRYREVIDVARGITITARAVEYPPVVAEALSFEGEALLRVGRATEARAALEESLWTAIGVGHDETAAESASSLVWLAGQHGRGFDEAMRWGELASASLQRAHWEDSSAFVQLENAVGAAQINAAHYDEGLTTFERALARLADDPLARARASTLRHNIAIQWLDRGDAQRARAVLEPAMAELEPIVGRDHPRLVAMRGTLAQVLGTAGDHPRAIALFREEVEGLALAHGDDAIQVAYARSNLGLELGNVGQIEESIAVIERALATFERVGDDSGGATAMLNLAQLYLDSGAYDAAVPRFERALAMLERAHPDGTHPDLAHPHVGIGRVRLASGRFAEAIESFERAERLAREGHGTVRVRGEALAGKGGALLALGRPNEALAIAAEQIAVMAAAGDAEPGDVPAAIAQHARVLQVLATAR
jgi:tetratricopeptide (TPR) repeat protein